MTSRVLAIGCLLMVSVPASAGSGERLSLATGVAGAGATTGAGLLGAGYLGVRLADRVYFDVGARPGVLGGPARIVTGIHFATRWFVSAPVFVRAGFVHQHETPLDDFVEEPLGVIAGASARIGHRSGADLGLGYRWTMPAVSTSGVHLSVSASSVWLPDRDGPHFYGVLESLVTVDLGKPSA